MKQVTCSLRAMIKRAHETLRPFLRAPVLDLVSIALVLILSAISVALYMKDVGSFFFYQTIMRSTVSWACGHSFGEPSDQIASLRAFLVLEAKTFDCAALDAATIGNTNPFTYAHFYLAWCVALLWRLFGVSQTALWPLAFLLHSAYATGAFTLARQFLGTAFSLVVGVAIAVSPIAVSMLFVLRDYTKAPFIVWSVVMIIAAIRARSARRALGLTAAAGALVGIGSGFRADVIVLMLPFTIAALCLSMRLVGRLSAVAILFAAFTVTASPWLWTASGLGASALLQGATEGFHRHLMLGSAAYDFGAKYSDELTLSAVAADLRKVDPNTYDAHESQPNLGLSQSLTHAFGYFARYATMFPADVLMRGIKSTVLTSGFFPLLRPDMRALDPFEGPKFPASTFLAQLVAPLWIGLGVAWLPFLTLAGLMLILAREYATAPPAALALGAVFGTLLFFPGFQFSLRHAFHLEPIAWISLAAIWPATSALRHQRKSVLQFSLWSVGFLGAALLLYAAALILQARTIDRETSRILEGHRELVAVRYETQGDQTLLAIDVPENFRPLVFGPVDSLTPDNIFRGSPWDVRAMSDRLLVTLSRTNCPVKALDLTFAYRGTPDTWQLFDRTVTAKFSENHDQIRIIYPGFYRPTQYFEGIRVASAARFCIDRVEKLQVASPLQSVFFMMLDAPRANSAHHLSFGRL